jgi:FKBP-type peptidyl-prolyl cis-trans isomerase 2
MRVAAGLTISIEYELRVKGGDVIESSTKSGPLRYQHGSGKMLPGLEKRLAGMAPGEERQGEIPAAEGFGTEASLPTKDMPRSEFPGGKMPALGLVFAAKSASGEAISFKVIAAAGDKVTVRLMHPLVGRDLTYRVKVLSIDPPSRPGAAPPLPPGVVETDLEEVTD